MRRSCMRRHTIGLAVVALAFAVPAFAGARTYFGFQIGVSNAPPPPRVVFAEPPPVYYVPQSRVYVVEESPYDCDVFHYGSYWYAVDDGYWYRSRSYRGPFAVVDVRYVPRTIFSVPQRHWRHYPRGISHRDRGAWANYGEDRRDRGHGNGH